jgi:hypothetical protein
LLTVVGRRFASIGKSPQLRIRDASRNALLILALAFAALAACGRSEKPSEPQPDRDGTGRSTRRPQTTPRRTSRQSSKAIPPVGSFSFEAYAYDCDELQVDSASG